MGPVVERRCGIGEILIRRVSPDGTVGIVVRLSDGSSTGTCSCACVCSGFGGSCSGGRACGFPGLFFFLGALGGTLG